MSERGSLRFSRQVLAFILAVLPFLFASNQNIFDRLQEQKWETAYDDWRKSHPAAKCRSFDGPGGLADEEWCYRCIEINGSESYETSFYAFDPDKPVCRLEQLRAWQTGPSIAEVQRGLESQLIALYGPSDSNNAVGEWSSGFWQDILHFRAKQGEVYLYRRVERSQPEAVEVRARSANLVAARAEDTKINELDSAQRAPVGTPFDRRLMQDLGKEFPGFTTLLSEEPEEARRPLQRQTIEQLLAAIHAAPAGRKAEMLLAADRVAGLLPDLQRGDPNIYQRVQTIAGFQLNYRYSELGGQWAYQHDLLKQVWRDYRNFEWGDAAFLLLERTGWDTSGMCESGSDQFREVIAHGEEFLANHPSGSLRLEALLAVGAAYETWWSLSRAGPNNDYVQPENYREGAEAARQKAIRLYEQVTTSAPVSLEAASARRELPRLKLGLDTVQRLYFCVYD
jgi:hypothetical protein